MKSQSRKKYDINAWIVLEGKIVCSFRTRKQARQYRKKHKVKRLNGYSYVGKCVDDYKNIILDI